EASRHRRRRSWRAPGAHLELSAFDPLGLIAPLARAVAELGYEKPTPVQEQAIPLVLAGRDLMAGAQTGTGKTAAFALPILQRFAPLASISTSPARHPVRALVLAPTRELAVQVAESFRDYGKHLPLRSTVVYGGVDMNAQIAELRRGVEILVTPRNVAAELVTHVLHPVAREKKRELLAYIIQTRGLKQVLVFTGTRIGANRLAHQLRLDRIQADAIHGDKTQAERELALAE